MLEDDSLEKVKKQLYSQTPKEGLGRLGTQRREAGSKNEAYEKDWTYEEEPRIFREPFLKKVKNATDSTVNKYFGIFVIVSVLVFVLTTLFVGYKLFFAGALISPRNVDISINAPATARAGDKLVFKVTIENSNRVDLLDAKITAVFPENTLSADESGLRVTEVVRSLGVIQSKGVREEEIEVLLFGQRDEAVMVEFFLDYGTENSNARLSNEERHLVQISTAPLSLRVAPSVREVQSGNQFEIEVDVTSNTTSRLDNIILEVVYPGGFNYLSSKPSAMAGDSLWRIGDLSAQETKTVTLKGYLEGQGNENRFFTFRVGEESGGGDSIGRLFASAQEPVQITTPQIALSTQINKSQGQTVSALTGQQIEVIIHWRNTLRDILTNMAIEVEIDDSYIKKGSITPMSGFYQSSTNTIRWDRTTTNSLATIEPLKNGSVSFSFFVADGNTLFNVVNPEIPFSITVVANEPQTTSPLRGLENRLERIVRIASNLIVTQNLSYSGGANPPQVGKESTYRVSWSAGNSGNETLSTSVRAGLPTYVTFIESDDDRIRFSPLTNEVVWNIGTIPENAGFLPSHQTSFDIRFTPSSTQIGKNALLVYDALIEGRDVFTGSIIRSNASLLNSAKVLP